MNNLVDYAVVAGAGALVTALLLRPARLISIQLGYQAMPDERKVHESPTPYGGGAAMLIGLCVAMLVAFVIPSLHNVMVSSNEMLGVLLAAGVIFIVGAVDDFRPMSAPAKVAGQFLAASVLYFSGCTMYQLKLPFAGFVVLGPSILPIITAVWVFALANAINLMSEYGDAVMNKESPRAVLAEIREFNQSNRQIKITMDGLQQSLRNRRKRVAQAQGGVYLPPKRKGERAVGRFFQG